jgi:hypothetical protein
MSLLDQIQDQKKREFWIRLIFWKGSALIAFILFAAAFTAYHFQWHLKWSVTARLQESTLISLLVVLGVASGISIIFAGLKSGPLPSDLPTTESVSQEAEEFRKKLERQAQENSQQAEELQKKLERQAQENSQQAEELQKKLERQTQENAAVIQDLEVKLQRIQEEGKKPRLIVVSWPGYTEESILASFTDFKVSAVSYVRGIDRATRFRIDNQLPDVLIVDVELYKLASEKERLIDLDREPELTRSIAAIHPAIRSHADVEIAEFVPLRLGLNSIAFSKQCWGRTPPAGYEPLFSTEACPASRGCDWIGIWNWYLPTMLVLFLATGHPPAHIVDLSFEETQSHLDSLWEHLDRSGFMQRVKVFYNHVESVIQDLEFGRVSIVPAGGGWAFRPWEPHGGFQRAVGTIIPDEGAIMWVEGGIILRNDEPKNRRSVQFIKRLLEEDSQTTLCMKGPYGGCPTNAKAIEHVRTDEYLRIRSDCDNIFTEDGTKLADNIHMRKLPKQHKLWEAWWDRFTEKCQVRYGAVLR